MLEGRPLNSRFANPEFDRVLSAVREAAHNGGSGGRDSSRTAEYETADTPRRDKTQAQALLEDFLGACQRLGKVADRLEISIATIRGKEAAGEGKIAPGGTRPPGPVTSFFPAAEQLIETVNALSERLEKNLDVLEDIF
jgi:hypothetical protein